MAPVPVRHTQIHGFRFHLFFDAGETLRWRGSETSNRAQASITEPGRPDKKGGQPRAIAKSQIREDSLTCPVNH